MEKTIAKTIKKWDKKVSHNSKAHHSHFPAAVDIVFKWAPMLSVFALDALDVKQKNNFKHHLFITAASEGLMNAVLMPVKNNVHRVRPNLSANRKSFPSGHTATAFLGAEVLRHEVADTNKVLGYGGYMVATTAGLLRMYNNKHWLSDIVAGAVLGFAMARCTYLLLRKIKMSIK